MTYTTLKPPTELWMCKDSTEPTTKVGIDEYVPLAAIAELVATICSMSVAKAEACIDRVCGQSDLLQTEAVWSRLHVVSAFELQRTGGLTQKQAAKLKAAVELGRRTYTVNPDLPTAVTDPATAYRLLADPLAYQSVERFAALALDIKHRPLAIKVLTQGSSTETLAPPRDIFRWALAVCSPLNCRSQSSQRAPGALPRRPTVNKGAHPSGKADRSARPGFHDPRPGKFHVPAPDLCRLLAMRGLRTSFCVTQSIYSI